MKELSGFSDMMENYEERKVDNFEGKNGLNVDTCSVTDSEKDYETGIMHNAYNNGDWIIVELYDTKEQAQKGHKKWVKKMTAKKLPNTLRDISTAEIAKVCDVMHKFMGGQRTPVSWRRNKKEKVNAP